MFLRGTYMSSGCFIKDYNHCTNNNPMPMGEFFLIESGLYNDDYSDYHNLLHLSKVVQRSVVKGQGSHANLALKWLSS